MTDNQVSDDLTVVKLEDAGRGDLYISSVYMAHDKPAPPDELVNVYNVISSNRANLLVGGDANARHALWGSSMTNERGESLVDFIINSNLVVCNVGSAPTFTFPSTGNCEGCREVLDLTLLSDNSAFRVENWRVSDLKSFSDHSWILFSVNFKTETPKAFRNPTKTDWKKFSRIFKKKLPALTSPLFDTVEMLDASVDNFEKAMKSAYKASCPVRYGRKTLPPWWNEDLSNLRRMTREVFNICYRHKFWQPYKDCLKIYKKAIKNSRQEAWRNYCQSIENIRDSARLSKILSKEHVNPSFMKKPDGTWTESTAESLELLMNTHFPGCSDKRTDFPTFRGVQQIPWNDLKPIINEENTISAINSFSPYKSPGLDGILPIIHRTTNAVEDENNLSVRLYNLLIIIIDLIITIVKAIFYNFEAIYYTILPKEKENVKNKVVLVTGTAHGIGKEIALNYASLGAKVVCWDINEKGNLEVVEDIKSRGGKAFHYTCNVLSRENIIEVVDKVKKEVGSIDIIVNNAGIMPCHPLLEHTENEINNIFGINVLAHFWIIQAILPDMIEKRKGHIVALSSCAGLLGTPNLVPYCASKYAVRGLMQALSEELRDDPRNSDIKTTTIYPYMVDTGLCKNPRMRFPSLFKLLKPEKVAQILVDAQRSCVEEISAPGYFLYMERIVRVIPMKSLRTIHDFFNVRVDSDKLN